MTWVDYGNGRTEGTLEGYEEAEPRLKAAREKLDAGEITPYQVLKAVRKIFGDHRKNHDWEVALDGLGGLSVPKGANVGDWERGIFEAWVEAKPLSYLKVYHSPEVVVRFVLNKVELVEALKGGV